MMLLHDAEKGNLANLDVATVEGSPSFPHKLSPHSNFYSQANWEIGLMEIFVIADPTNDKHAPLI